MKGWRLIVILFVICLVAGLETASAQCSICTKTAGQLGEKQGLGLNSGIVYLMLAPFAIVGYVGYKWWSKERG